MNELNELYNGKSSEPTTNVQGLPIPAVMWNQHVGQVFIKHQNIIICILASSKGKTMITKLKLIMMLSALNSTINMIDAFGHTSPQGVEIAKSE